VLEVLPKLLMKFIKCIGVYFAPCDQITELPTCINSQVVTEKNINRLFISELHRVSQPVGRIPLLELEGRHYGT
jgi:hypothetical protein